MAHPQHEQVRRAFAYRCAYCGVEETEMGAELTVDHYQPRARGGADDLENLVYACHRCNQYKGDYWQTPEESAASFIVLHPFRHDLSLHYRENEMTGKLEALTETGTFNIRLLYLNRPPLMAHRLVRRAAKTLQQRIQVLETQAKQREQTIQVLQEYIRLLLRLGRIPPPSDE